MFLLGRDPAAEAGPGAISKRSDQPDWAQADPRAIEAALERALAKPSGGWAVLDATRTIRCGPRRYVVAGRELVAWWCSVPGREGPRVGPDVCPHMGAELSKGSVDQDGRIVCPWHALALDGERPQGSFRPVDAHDDGVLTWVRLPELLAPGEAPTDAPTLPKRPSRFLDAVIRMEAACEPRDVLANRLDPWHGVHFHPHSFARLRVVDHGDDFVTVRVVYRIAGRVGMEVDARFDCPDPRTIVMTIVAGEGIGSVVETHACPIGPARTAIIEATLATSDRPEVISWLPSAGWLRPLVQARARRLWVDDVAYCERTYAIRGRRRSDIA